MDHQVAHDVDVGAALRKGAQAVDLGEAGRGDALAHHPHRRVEPLLMSDLEHPALAPRKLHESVGLLESRRNRLLYEHVDGAPEDLRAEVEVGHGRHSDDGGIGFGEQSVEVDLSANPELGSNAARPLRIGIGNACEHDVAFGPRALRHLRGVKATHVSYADDDQAGRGHGALLRSVSASTPTTEMPRASARRATSSRSSTTVAPDSKASATADAASRDSRV